MTKIILLNGPSGSGKDTLADAIEDYRTKKIKFAEPLRRLVIAALNLDNTDQAGIWLEHNKNVPNDSLMGMTPREYMIWMSEKCYKPRFGKAVFGRIAVDRIRVFDSIYDIFTVSDSGFDSEAQVLVDEFGSNNIMLVHLHRDGCTFMNDSRSYIELDHVRQVDIFNDFSIDIAVKSLNLHVKAWLNDTD